MTQDLIGRVQRLLMSPKTEWDAIDGEAVDTQKLITGYVAPLAAIPAIAGLIGTTVFGISFLGETYRTPIMSALVLAVVQFALAIAMVFVVAFIIDMLAPQFGAQKSNSQALKVAAYWPTAIWVSGIFSIIPMLGILSLIGLIYSLYLLFIGLPKLMKPAPDKATTYTIVTIVAAIVASLIIGLAVSIFAPKPPIPSYGATMIESGADTASLLPT
ncbi:MAG: Yip1 family protein [Amphiplicatus sp.]